jgi:acetoin utilization protein AcuB
MTKLSTKPSSSQPTERAARHLRISDVMTSTLHSIGDDQSLQTAHELMRRHGIHHLPVLRAGRLVGIVSHRDLLSVETMSDVDPKEVTVEQAMTQETYSVPKTALLASVAAKMAANHFGCAVVMEAKTVVGIFTTTDALRAVAAMASGERPTAPGSAWHDTRNE